MDDNIITNQTSQKLTYTPWYDHVTQAIKAQWKSTVVYWIVMFGVFWGLIEASSFFFSEYNLNSHYVFALGVFMSLLISVIKNVIVYINTPPTALANETKKIHKIVLMKKAFLEYALVYELINNRISEIDKQLSDVLENRVHIPVTNSLDLQTYIEWLQRRPENPSRIVDIAKQLIIYVLMQVMHADESCEVDYSKLLNTVNLISNLYKNVYEFEVEGKQIMIPEEFNLIHEIQSQWVHVVRDGFHQMLNFLQTIAIRAPNDFSPVNYVIVFSAPPRLEEFTAELTRIELAFNHNE